MTLVEVVTEAGLRGYGSVQAQVASASNHHALVISITAETQPLLPLGSYRAKHGRPARIPHWLLSSLLNRGKARDSFIWWPYCGTSVPRMSPPVFGILCTLVYVFPALI